MRCLLDLFGLPCLLARFLVGSIAYLLTCCSLACLLARLLARSLASYQKEHSKRAARKQHNSVLLCSALLCTVQGLHGFTLVYIYIYIYTDVYTYIHIMYMIMCIQFSDLLVFFLCLWNSFFSPWRDFGLPFGRLGLPRGPPWRHFGLPLAPLGRLGTIWGTLGFQGELGMTLVQNGGPIPSK